MREKPRSPAFKRVHAEEVCVWGCACVFVYLCMCLCFCLLIGTCRGIVCLCVCVFVCNSRCDLHRLENEPFFCFVFLRTNASSHRNLKGQHFAAKWINFNGITTINGFTCRDKLNLQICTVDQEQAGLTVTIFEGTEARRVQNRGSYCRLLTMLHQLLSFNLSVRLEIAPQETMSFENSVWTCCFSDQV